VDAVDEVKARLSIEELVGRYVDLKRSGSSLKGLCPFHNEKTPSFYVSPSRGTYHCFGCGKGGDSISFFMEMEHLQFPDALKRLAEQTGVSLPERQKPSLKKTLYEVNERAAEYFRAALGRRDGQRARSYLHERHFGDDAIDAFDLGFAPSNRDALCRQLKGHGFDDRVLLAAGLALQDDVGGPTIDRFRGRLMFPIRDQSGHILGFGGRALGDIQPKYLNSPQTEIFDKSSVLFGIQRAADAIRQSRRAILVEGYLDAVRAQMAGYLDVVASLGTAVTPAQLRGLVRLADTVVLALDPDPAGLAATARASLTALASIRSASGHATIDLRVARLPGDAGDPDEAIRDHPEQWDRAIDSSVPAFEFVFDHTVSGLNRSSDAWRQEAIDSLLPLIQQFAGSPGWQATWIQRLATETGVDIRAIQHALPGRSAPSRRRPSGPSSQPVVTGTTSRALTADPHIDVERGLVALLLKLVVVPDEAAALLDSAEITTPDLKSIVHYLLDWRTRGNYDYEMFRETLPAAQQELADELRGLDVPLPDGGKTSVAVAYHLARLRQFDLQSRLARTQALLAEVDDGDRPAALAGLARLMDERHAVERDLDWISRKTVQLGQGTIDQDSESW